MIFGVSWHMAAFEAWEAVIFVLCLIHAIRSGIRVRERVALLLAGTIYGLTLETLTIYQLHAYYYGTFLVMVKQVPLAIAVGWGIILYSAVAFADALPLTPLAWSALVGLLGLNIDLSMDAVAIRVHMWNWLIPFSYSAGKPYDNLPLTAQWFGVPYGNFYSWFIVLASFAGLFRLLKAGNAKTVWGTIGRSAAAYFSSLIILIGLDQFYYVVFAGSKANYGWIMVALEIALAAAALLTGVRGAKAAPRDIQAIKGFPSFGVPFAFHMYFTFMLLTLAISAAFAAPYPILLVISGLMLLVSFALHIGRHFIAAKPDTKTVNTATPVEVAAATE